MTRDTRAAEVSAIGGSGRPQLSGVGIAACCFLISASLSGVELVSTGLVGVAVLVILNEIVKSRRIESGAWIAVPFLVYWMASALFVGAVPLSVSGVATWLAHDGRPLLALLPLVLLGSIRGTPRDLQIIVLLLTVLTWVNAIAAVALGANGAGVVAGLTSSHHALGFWSAGATVVLAHHRRAIGRAALGPTVIAAGATVVLSGSRSAALALGISLIWLVFRSQRFSQVVQVVLALSIGFGLLLYSSDRIKDTADSVMDPRFRSELSSNFRSAHSQYEAGGLNVSIGATTTAEANILRRAAIFGSALGRWSASPFVGIGSGRYNDQFNEYSGAKGVVYVATSGDIVLNDSDAHNSYLQLLAENGLVGCLLLIAMFARLWRRARNPEAPLWASVAGRQLIVVLLGSALAGHTFASPAATYPLLVLAGVVGGLARLRPDGSNRLT